MSTSGLANELFLGYSASLHFDTQLSRFHLSEWGFKSNKLYKLSNKSLGNPQMIHRKLNKVQRRPPVRSLQQLSLWLAQRRVRAHRDRMRCGCATLTAEQKLTQRFKAIPQLGLVIHVIKSAGQLFCPSDSGGSFRKPISSCKFWSISAIFFSVLSDQIWETTDFKRFLGSCMKEDWQGHRCVDSNSDEIELMRADTSLKQQWTHMHVCMLCGTAKKRKKKSACVQSSVRR